MLAIAISRPGDPSVLQPTTRDVPQARAGEILIRTRAAGINRPDLLQRQGSYPPPPGASDLPGLEVAGEIVAVGEGVERWKTGDQVTALTPGGGYAEYCRTHEACALPMPQGLSFEEAATLPETFFTVWFNAFELCRLQPGETLLVHGGSSGIGTAAIQIAAALGVNVIATAGSERKCDACMQLGAALAINYRDEDFVTAIADHTRGKGADVILDMVGGPYVARNYRAAAHRGRIAQIALLEGMVAETDFATMMIKQLVHTGSMLRPQPVEQKAAIRARLGAAGLAARRSGQDRAGARYRLRPGRGLAGACKNGNG